MRVVKVMAGPHNRLKLLGGSAPDRPPAYVWSQVPGIDEQLPGPARAQSWKRAKLLAAAEVAIGIYLLRLAKERVMARSKFAAEIGTVVATVAVALRIDEVTAFSD